MASPTMWARHLQNSFLFFQERTHSASTCLLETQAPRIRSRLRVVRVLPTLQCLPFLDTGFHLASDEPPVLLPPVLTRWGCGTAPPALTLKFVVPN